MTLLSRRDIGKILVAGSTGLALGAQNAFGAMPSPTPKEADPQSGKQKSSAKPGSPARAASTDTAKRASQDAEPYWSDVLLADGPEPIVS
jgi:hypothetical protein